MNEMNPSIQLFRPVLFSLSSLLLAAVLAACGSSARSAGPDTTAVPTASSQATSSGGAPAVTGVKDLDVVVAALVAQDEAALAPQLGLTEAACTTSGQEAATGQPMCSTGEAAGTRVRFLPETVTGVCRTAVRQRAISEPELGELAHWLVPDGATKLYAIYRTPATAAYTVVFTRTTADSGYGVLVKLLTVDGGKLVAIRSHCGEVGMEQETIADLLAGVQASDFVVTPDQAIERNAITVTISPTSGPVGTAVTVQLSGVAMGALAPFALVSFKDSTGAFGEDELTTDYVVDPRTVGPGGSKEMTYRIPANVLVAEFPDAQNPTKKTPTSGGQGYIVFTNSIITVEVPFTVVGR